MEVELQSWGAGRGTRSRAGTSLVGNWKMSGNLGADGKSRMWRERALEGKKAGEVHQVTACGLGPPTPTSSGRLPGTAASVLQSLPKPPPPAPQLEGPEAKSLWLPLFPNPLRHSE